jgi:hypothetical protein
LNSHENGIELEGPTAGRSQSFETYEDEQRSLNVGDFDTTRDEQTGELTVNECPNHQTATDQQRSDKTGKINVHFDPDVCSSCPVKIGKLVANYTVDEAEYVGAVRHHEYMTNGAYKFSKNNFFKNRSKLYLWGHFFSHKKGGKSTRSLIKL